MTHRQEDLNQQRSTTVERLNALPSSRPRRIGIDVVWAGGQPTGTGVYTIELVRALLRQDPQNTYVLYFRNPSKEQNVLWQVDAPNIEKRVVGPKSNNLRNQALAYHLYRDRVDLFHSTGFFLPYLWMGPKVVSIHDVNYLRYARYQWRAGRRGSFLSLVAQTPLSAHQARKIVTGSQFSAGDIVRYLHVRPDKVHVVPDGVRSNLNPNVDRKHLDAVRSRYQLDDYVLYVGIMSPQKNLERLIRAFALSATKQELRPDGQRRLKLVLVGKDDGPYTDEVLRPLARDLNFEDRIVFAGYVPNEELNALYVGAHFLAMVSEGEGFGLPIVEAMACGTPVLSANTTALTEVAGDAALLVNPADLEGIAAALSRLSWDDQLRRALREKGLRQAAKFTWDETARQTLRMYFAAMRMLSK